MTTKPLYHFTCAHAVPLIQDAGVLLSPFAHQGINNPAFLTDLVWLTTLDEGNAKALGLTRNTLRCDRTEYRVTTQWDTSDVQPWGRYYKRLLKAHPRHLARPWIERLELSEGALPGMWYVTDRPVPIKLIERVSQWDTCDPQMIWSAELTTPNGVPRGTEPRE